MYTTHINVLYTVVHILLYTIHLYVCTAVYNVYINFLGCIQTNLLHCMNLCTLFLLEKSMNVFHRHLRILNHQRNITRGGRVVPTDMVNTKLDQSILYLMSNMTKSHKILKLMSKTRVTMHKRMMLIQH